nr:helix-turn-helix domain-containing protein [Pseudofrankia asymbiotica]
MPRTVRARRLTDEEGQALVRMVRRGRHDAVKVRRAMMILASASGNTNEAIAALVAADPDTVRDVIHAFNDHGLECLDPKWAGGRPRRITTTDEARIVEVARTRPRALGLPFTHWSLRKLSDYLCHPPAGVRPVIVRWQRLGELLHRHRISFQRTRTWKETTDPDADAKLARIEDVARRLPDRCFRLRPVRPTVHPPLPRDLLGRGLPP